MINVEHSKHSLLLNDIPDKALIYNSVFLNPHLPKNHLDGQNPVQIPMFNITVTNIIKPQDCKINPAVSTQDISRYTIFVSVIDFNNLFIVLCISALI